MGDPKGFIKIQRKEAGNRPVPERIYDYSEVEQTLNTEDRKLQASRCMECGIPFCHWGCPVENIIPEWNDAVYKGEWRRAIDLMHATNNFPEFTGRICPAPCEHACVLNIEGSPVTIRENEAAIAEFAFSEGYIKPKLVLPDLQLPTSSIKQVTRSLFSKNRMQLADFYDMESLILN
jgi:glutamate synthase (NADPH/NADH) small chain